MYRKHKYRSRSGRTVKFKSTTKNVPLENCQNDEAEHSERSTSKKEKKIEYHIHNHNYPSPQFSCCDNSYSHYQNNHSLISCSGNCNPNYSCNHGCAPSSYVECVNAKQCNPYYHNHYINTNHHHYTTTNLIPQLSPRSYPIVTTPRQILNNHYLHPSSLSRCSSVPVHHTLLSSNCCSNLFSS